MLFILSLSIISYSQDVAVVFTSDVAAQIGGAAVFGVKYPSCTFYDLDGLDASTSVTTIDAITDASLHKIYVICDTATAWADNKLTGALWDTLADKFYASETGGIEPDTLPILISAQGVIRSKTEVAWDTCFTLTRPLIVQYLGFSDFSSARGIAKYASTDSTIIDSTQNWTDGQFDGQWVYVRSGTNIGEYRVIDSTYGTGEYVRTTVDFTSANGVTTNYVIKKAGESDELFYDIYTELYVLAYLYELDNSAILKYWKRLMDYGNNINTVYLTPIQDLDYLWNTVIAGGTIIFSYLKL